MTLAVVITGAAGGIGAAICERMRSDGYFTVGLDRVAAPAADTYLNVDLSDSVGIQSLGRELASDYDLKAIIHNAAVQPIAGAGETPIAQWSNVLSVNVIAIDALVSGSQRSLAVNDGSIIVVSSVHGRATTGGVTAYAATKAGLEGWVRSAAIDLGPHIRVNAIAPGAINTPKLHQGFARWGEESAEQRMAVLRKRTALQRIGEPGDVAGAASFLIGADARFVTGAVLVVDGGATARLGSE